jgi:hypothetical protein
MIRPDLPNDLANADGDYEGARGREADFHALRHTFISNLARAGVHPRNAQALARHSTIELTMGTYTHVEMGDLASDLEGLPAIVRAPAGLAKGPSATVPAELAALAGGWGSLPEHVRQAIATLAGA